jgi:hypothetical protein
MFNPLDCTDPVTLHRLILNLNERIRELEILVKPNFSPFSDDVLDEFLDFEEPSEGFLEDQKLYDVKSERRIIRK